MYINVSWRSKSYTVGVSFFKRDIAMLTVQFKLWYSFVVRLSELPCLSFKPKILTVM